MGWWGTCPPHSWGGGAEGAGGGSWCFATCPPILGEGAPLAREGLVVLCNVFSPFMIHGEVAPKAPEGLVVLCNVSSPFMGRWRRRRRRGSSALPGAVQCSSDRTGPDPERATDNGDPPHVSDMNAAPELLPNWLEQHVAGGSDSAADHDPVDGDQDDDIARADSQVTARLVKALLRAGVPGSSRGHRLLDAGPPASRGDGVGPGKRLEAAVIAAVAPRSVGKDRLMAELPGGALVTKVEMPIEDQPSTHACAERDAQHRPCAAARAETVLRQGESARVIDQPDR